MGGKNNLGLNSKMFGECKINESAYLGTKASMGSNRSVLGTRDKEITHVSADNQTAGH